MTEHLEVGELHEGGGFEVHIVGADFLATFFYRFANVFLLGALVVPQASDEVVERFLEPENRVSRVCINDDIAGLMYMVAVPQEAFRSL